MKITMLVAAASIALIACSGHAVEVPTDDDGTTVDETKSTTSAPAPAPTATAAEQPAPPSTDSKSDPTPAQVPPQTTPPKADPPCDSPNVAVICQNGNCFCGAGPKSGQACADQQTCKQVCAYCD